MKPKLVERYVYKSVSIAVAEVGDEVLFCAAPGGPDTRLVASAKQVDVEKYIDLWLGIAEIMGQKPCAEEA